MMQLTYSETRTSNRHSNPPLMALLKWFDSTEATAFASTVAEEFTKQFPPQGTPFEKRLERPADKKKFERILKKVFEFSSKTQPNFYVKAKFLKALMSELQQHGHNEETTQKIIEALTVRL